MNLSQLLNNPELDNNTEVSPEELEAETLASEAEADTDTGVDTDPEVEGDTEGDPEVDAEADLDTGDDAEAEADLNVADDAEAEDVADTDPEVDAEADLDTGDDAEAEADLDVADDAEAEDVADTDPEVDAEADLDTGDDAEAEADLDVADDAEAEDVADTDPEVDTEADLDTGDDAEAEDIAIEVEDVADEGEDLAASAEVLAVEAEANSEGEDLAAQASDLAAEAEDLAAESEGLAASAEDLAERASDLAAEAEDLAAESEDLAAEAEDLAAEAEDLAAEAEGLAAEAEDADPEAEGEDVAADPDTEDDTDADTEAEADGELDTGDDADADTEAEAEADGDLDTGDDADADADTEAEADGELDTGDDADADADTEAEAEGDLDTGDDADADADTEVEAEGDLDTGDDADAGPEDSLDDIDLEDADAEGNIDVDGTLDTEPDADLDEALEDADAAGDGLESDGSLLGAPAGGPPDAEGPEILVDADTQGVAIVNEDPTISVLWDIAAQDAIAANPQGPTVAARTLGLVHTAIYDAWSAYDETAISSTTGDDALQVDQSENTDANKIEAVSYAAYQTLTDLLPEQVPIFDQLMEDLGLDPNATSTDPSTALGIGTLSATALLDARRGDGSNQTGDDPGGDGTPYSDTTGFTTPNTPDNVVDIELFTPENTPVDEQPLGENAQVPLTPQFGDVDPFGLESGDQFRPEGPEGFLVEGVDAEVDLDAGTITLADGTVEEISQDLIGEIINPGFIEQAQEIVDISANLTDEQKLIAEFWEDGPGTSFPPGNGLAFGQYVSARDNNTLDEDVEQFFALGNSQLDSAIAAWDSKYAFNYARPLRAIRELGEQGLIGEFNEDLGGFAIEAYAGPGEGTQTILAEDFITYQFGETESSPPFPEYVSGHSTFAAAAAEVLQQSTGSDDFGGSVSFDPGSSRFEPGLTPAETVTLEWDTFTEFADESGESRLFGGIHFSDGNEDGLDLGRQVGNASFEQAQFFINGGDGSAGSDPVTGNDGSEALTGGTETDPLADQDGEIQPDAGLGDDSLGDIAQADPLTGDPTATDTSGGIGDDSLVNQNDVLDDGQGNSDELNFTPPELAGV